MAKYRITPSSKAIIQLPISIGHKAEKGVEAIEFDVTAWVETYGSGTLTVIMRRWGDAIPYPIALEIDENNKATWTLSDIDTAKAGMAYAQLNYIVGDEVVKKSDIYTFRVMDSLTGEGEPPEAYESWLEHLTHFAAEAMAEVLDIEGIVTDKTLTVDGGIADGKATGDALALKADKSTTYTKTEVDTLIESVDVETDTTLSVSGKPADSKTVGDELSEIKADLDEAFINSVNLFDKNAIVPNQVLDIGSGKNINSMHSSQLYCVSNIIPVEVSQYVWNSLFADTQVRLNLYNENGDYLGGGNGTAQADGSYIFNVTSSVAKYGRFTYKPTTLDANTFMFVKGDTLPVEYAPHGKLLNPSYAERQIQTAVDNYEIPNGSVTPAKTSFSEHDPNTNLIDISKCTLGYINGAVDGTVKPSTTMYITDYIPLKSGIEYYYNSNYLYGGYCAFYNANKVYIDGYGQASADSRLPVPFIVPNNAVYGRFTIATESRLPDVWLCETNQMTTKPQQYSNKIKTKFIEKRPTDYMGNEISVFTKILCIGDSLTDGFFNESNGSRLIMRNRAYPAKLQALTGIECTNMGYAGYTSAQWYNAYQNEDLSGHDACIIQLGVNDQLQNVSEADMDTSLTSIVNKVKADNNGIKIFVATILPANGYMTANMRTRSQMIRDFVSNLNDANVYLVDLWTYGHTDDYLAYDAGHLSALGYLRLAEDYKAYISSIISNNKNDFRYVQFIGTNYTFTGMSYMRDISYT